MRQTYKFMHTLGAIGMMGAMACLLILLHHLPEPQALDEYARLRIAMGDIASWILLPSLGLVLVGGLLALGMNSAYHNAGWAWLKLATGILVFEWTLTAIQGPIQTQAEVAMRALAGKINVSEIEHTVGAEQISLWIMLGVATVNVVLGIWRPRLTRRKRNRSDEIADSG